MKKQSKYFHLVFIILFITSCISCKKKANISSESSPSVDTLNAELSYINMPISFDMSDLQQKLNEALPTILFQDNSLEGDGLTIRIIKNGTFVLSGYGSTLTCSAPLKIDVVMLKKGLFRKKNTTKKHEFSFSILALLETPILISPYWEINTKTKLKSIKWIETPKITIGPINIDISKKVEAIIKEESESIMLAIDKEIEKALPLKTKIAKIWNDVHKPIKVLPLPKERVIAMQAIPIQLFGSLPEITSDEISFRVSMILEAYASEISTDADLEINPDLAKLESKKNINDSFDIHLLSELSYSTLSHLISKKLKNQEINYANISAKIADIQLSEYYGKILISISFTGAFAGNLVLVGIPHFNLEEAHIEFSTLEYEIDSKYGILNTTDWFLHENVQAYLQSKLNIPLSDISNALPTLIMQGVQNSKLDDKLELNIPHLELYEADMAVFKTNLQLRISTKGTSDLSFLGCNYQFLNLLLLRKIIKETKFAT